MKYLLLALIVCALAVPCAFADETDGGVWTAPNAGLENWLNTNDIDHTHGYADEVGEDYDSPLGIGADVKLWNFTGINYLTDVTAETKYDINNEEFGAFLVLGIDLTSLYQ